MTWICSPCQRGNHDGTHSRYTATGADGGCPNAKWVDNRMVAECACRVVLPMTVAGRCPTCGRPNP